MSENLPFPERRLSGRSIAKLNALLHLPADSHMQDWAVECADSRRVSEFVELYENTSLTEDDRFALMALIIASFDDWMWENPHEGPLVQKIRCHLSDSFQLHESTVRYWALLEEPDAGNAFQVSPLMRQIWQEKR